MNNLIYYPTFEPHSDEWLKFALVHIESFSPIVPVSGQEEVSDLFRMIRDSTNLVKTIEPTSGDGTNATNKIIREIESTQSKYSSYETILGLKNFKAVWKNKKNWSTTLYREKYHDNFSEFCLSEGFGKKHDRGLNLSPELSNFYMTFLAEEIAFSKQASPITDLLRLDSLSTYLRTKDVKQDETIKAAQVILQTKLPKELGNISFERLIEFRNHSEINELRQAFNKTLESFYEAVENNFDPFTYLEKIKKTNTEYIKEIVLFFGGIAACSLGAIILLKSENPSGVEIAKEVTEAAVLTVAGAYGVNQAWKLNEDRRNARKFLTRIKSI